MMMPDSYEIKENGILAIMVNEVEYEFAEKEDFIYSDKKKSYSNTTPLSILPLMPISRSAHRFC